MIAFVVTVLVASVAAFGLGSALLGAWVGKKIVDRVSDRFFVLAVELGLLAAGVLFLIGH